MAYVKTFKVSATTGVPDKHLREFISNAEARLGLVTVTTQFIPSDVPIALRTSENAVGLFTVIVTKLDDYKWNPHLQTEPEPPV